MRPDRDPTRRDLLATLGFLGAGGVTMNALRWPGIRQRLLVSLNPIISQLGMYTAYQLNAAEFVGQAERGTLEFRASGYERNPLSAAKLHPETGEVDQASWRRIDPDNPRWQWHVHTWTDETTTEVFSHYEYRPDLLILGEETPSEMFDRLEMHYNPKWDTNHDAAEATYFLGKACSRVREHLDG